MGSYANSNSWKGSCAMRNMRFTKFSKALSSMLAVVLLAMSAIPAQAAPHYETGGIMRRDDIRVDYSPYLNSDVVHKLPDTIRADEEISIIVTTGEISLMDAYESSAKTMSFGEYAVGSRGRASALQVSQNRDSCIVLRELLLYALSQPHGTSRRGVLGDKHYCGVLTLAEPVLNQLSQLVNFG